MTQVYEQPKPVQRRRVNVMQGEFRVYVPQTATLAQTRSILEQCKAIIYPQVSIASTALFADSSGFYILFEFAALPWHILNLLETRITQEARCSCATIVKTTQSAVAS